MRKRRKSVCVVQVSSWLLLGVCTHRLLPVIHGVNYSRITLSLDTHTLAWWHFSKIINRLTCYLNYDSGVCNWSLPGAVHGSHLSALWSAGSPLTGTAPCPAGMPPQRTSASLWVWPVWAGPLLAPPLGLSVHALPPAPLQTENICT